MEDDIPRAMKQLPTTRSANGGSCKARTLVQSQDSSSTSFVPVCRMERVGRRDTVAVAVRQRTRHRKAETRTPQTNPILTNRYWRRMG